MYTTTAIPIAKRVEKVFGERSLAAIPDTRMPDNFDERNLSQREYEDHAEAALNAAHINGLRKTEAKFMRVLLMRRRKYMLKPTIII